MKLWCALLSVLATLVLVSPAANADLNTTPQSWFCTADGYDQNNQIRSISGEYKPTKKLAEQSALRSCNGFYMGCRVRSCFQMQ